MAEVVDDIELGRYALRTFRIDYRKREMRSLTQNSKGPSEWIKGTCEARCRNSSHPAPDYRCSCGIYGTNSADSLFEQFELYAKELIAVIAAEGITVVGDTGLRTQAARVVAYWPSNSAIGRVCHRDFPDAKKYKDLNDMLIDYNFSTIKEVPRSFLTQRRVVWLLFLWCWFFLTYDFTMMLIEMLTGRRGPAILNAACVVTMAAITSYVFRRWRRVS